MLGDNYPSMELKSPLKPSSGFLDNDAWAVEAVATTERVDSGASTGLLKGPDRCRQALLPAVRALRFACKKCFQTRTHIHRSICYIVISYICYILHLYVFHVDTAIAAIHLI